MVNSTLKNTQKLYFCGMNGISLRQCEEKKKDRSCIYIGNRDNQIATSAKLLDVMHESYGFSGDLYKRDH